jgi:hypothetical protein
MIAIIRNKYPFFIIRVDIRSTYLYEQIIFSSFFIEIKMMQCHDENRKDKLNKTKKSTDYLL